VNVLVIGAGVVGAAVAEALASRGVQVTVVEMRSPGRGASQASAGILAPYVEALEDSPLQQLATRSLELYDEFIARITRASGRAVEYSRSGTLQVALNDDDVSRLRTMEAWVASAGVPHEWLDRDALRRLEPTVSGSAAGGLLIPAHGWVGALSLVTALVHAARLAGASFEAPVEVVHVDPKDDRVEVRADARAYHADAVVVAAGSWSSRIRITGHGSPSVRPIRGQLLHLRSADRRPSRVLWGTRCYIVPWSEGSCLVGGTLEDVGFDETTTVAAIRDLMDAASELVPSMWQASLEAVRVGLRPVTADALPMIGPLTSAPRVTMATGHYRNGVLLAPLTAEIVARYVCDGEQDPAFAITTPGRFESR
jgi:glycine oxidase